jgi:hypothetical protein
LVAALESLLNAARELPEPQTKTAPADRHRLYWMATDG